MSTSFFGKYYIALGTKKFMFFIAFNLKTRICVSLGFDAYPNFGWKNNRKIVAGFIFFPS